jgi:hypothetical protein
MTLSQEPRGVCLLAGDGVLINVTEANDVKVDGSAKVT